MLEYSLVNSLAHKAKMGKELLSRFMAVDDSDDEEGGLPRQASVLCEVYCRQHVACNKKAVGLMTQMYDIYMHPYQKRSRTRDYLKFKSTYITMTSKPFTVVCISVDCRLFLKSATLIMHKG